MHDNVSQTKILRDLRDLESVLEESNDLWLLNLNVIAAVLFNDSLEELDNLKTKILEFIKNLRKKPWNLDENLGRK